MLQGNLQRWQTHLESTRLEQEQQARIQKSVNYVAEQETMRQKKRKNCKDKRAKSTRKIKVFQPFNMKNVRRLPIVGDIHNSREAWPYTELDWVNLLGINPQPIKLSKLVYSINQEEGAFDAISLIFNNQEFKSHDLKATDC